MDSIALQRFIAMAESGSLSKAAARLGITQPALTRTLQALEAHYGAELLHRRASGVELTTFGQAVLMRAKLISAELRHLDGEINALRSLTMGQVSVGIPSGIGFTSQVLPAATLALLTEASRLEIAYTIGTHEHLLTSLRRGDLDFVIAGVSSQADASDLVQESILQDHVGVVVRAEHPLSQKRQVSATTLAQYPWAVLSDSAGLEDALRQALASGGAPFGRSVLRSNSALFVRSIVTKSDAVGLMSLDAARPDLDRGLVRELRVPHGVSLLPVRELGLIYRRDSVLSTAAQALVMQIQQACRQRKVGRSRRDTEGRRSMGGKTG